MMSGPRLSGFLPEVVESIRGMGVRGGLLFAGLYALATVAFVPGSILTLAAGALFGVAGGVLWVFLGATLGAALAFLTGRYLARAWVEERVARSPRFASVDRAIGREGLRIVFLLRLSPVVPFNLLNYALGMTRVRFPQFLAGSVGMLPGTLLYVYSGRVVGEVAAAAGGRADRDPGDWAVLALGLVATAAVAALVTRTARQALAEAAVNGGGEAVGSSAQDVAGGGRRGG